MPRMRTAKPVLIVAVFLIVAGTFLFLSNIGLLPVEHPWSFWPVGVVAVGLAKLLGSRTFGERTWSFLIVIFGTLFLLVSVGVFEVRLHDGSWPVSVLLIAAGIAALSRALNAGPFHKPETSFLPPGIFNSGAELMNDSVILGAWKRRIETLDFRGGQVQAYLGAVEIDLRPARIGGPEWIATLELAAVFGAVRLRIPEGWKVAVQGVGILGNFEDKTIPQVREIGDLGTLVISGYSIGSNIEIEN